MLNLKLFEIVSTNNTNFVIIYDYNFDAILILEKLVFDFGYAAIINVQFGSFICQIEEPVAQLVNFLVLRQLSKKLAVMLK
jgi:hypothetical protein